MTVHTFKLHRRVRRSRRGPDGWIREVTVAPISIEVDVGALASLLGDKAVLSKGHKARITSGAVTVYAPKTVDWQKVTDPWEEP